MGYNSLLRIPKKEEQEVPDSTASAHRFVDIKEQPSCYADGGDIDIMDELEGIWRVNNNNNDDKEYQRLATDHSPRGQLIWDFMDMDWEGFANNNGDEEEDDEREEQQIEFTRNFLQHQEGDPEKKIINIKGVKKEEELGFWDEEDENRASSLNLNLNYQQVLDAWSDRGPLWTDDFSLSSVPSYGYYMGEVPVMEEDKTRREASVLRYKEKRQSRLFSKRIRYQVRKLNADKRPRLKGRFVKRV
ncbi:hypothetical protein AB3S75_041305 [Citrus x aurantiifolia]